MSRFAAILAFFVWTLPIESAIVQLDYSFDAANGNFFGTNPTAKAAVDAAAQDISNAITSSLGAITTDIYSGTSGGTTVDFDWRLHVTNPSTGATVVQSTFNTPVNLMTIYVGMQPLTGMTLGIGGPASVGIGASASGPAGGLPAAVGLANAASNAAMQRGAGPIIGTLSGSIGGTSYALNFGAIRGSLSFDSDSDNNGSADTPAELAAYWHYDHTAAVAAGKNDLYSVALHEILHSIGFGTADTWTGLTLGTTWTGSNVIALTGSGANMVSADGGHIADGAMSTRLSDGGAQEAVMDPSITQGTRKSLTQLDLAFLRDIGFATVPEPSSVILVFVAALPFALARRRNAAAAFA